MPSSTTTTTTSPTKSGGGWSSSQRSSGGSVSPTKPSSASASRAATPLSSSASKLFHSIAIPTRHIPPGCSHLASLLSLPNPSSTNSASSHSTTKIKFEDDSSLITSFDSLAATARSYLKRYISGLRWGSQIRRGYVKMMDDDEKLAEAAKHESELSAAAKQGKQTKKRRKLDYPQCGTCQADMLRPFICLECAFTGCFSPMIHDDPTAVTKTHRDSHVIQHLRSKQHAFAFDLLYGHVYCRECNDFVHDPLLESIQRYELSKVGNKPVGQQYGSSKSTLESLFPPANTQGTAAINRFYQTQPNTVTCRTPRGLRNMGATCFMNVIIQAFLHNSLLRNYFLSDRHNPSLCNGGRTCLACELDKMFAEFYSADPGALPQSSFASCTETMPGSAHGAIVSTHSGIGASTSAENGTSTGANVQAKGPHGPTSFLYCLWVDQASSELGQAGQQDAHELFISALNSIHTALTSRALERSSLPTFEYDPSDSLNRLFDHYEGGASASGSGNQSEDEGMGVSGGGGEGGASRSTLLGLGVASAGGVAGCPCVVHRTFAGQLQSDVKCQRCGKVNTTRDPMLDLSLDVRPDSMRKGGNNNNGSSNGVLGSNHSMVGKAKLVNGKINGVNANGNGANGVGDGEEEQHLTICLQRYCSEENLGNNDYSCAGCGGSASATKQLSLYRLPPVLCIQLKCYKDRYKSSFPTRPRCTSILNRRNSLGSNYRLNLGFFK
uniref:Related to UBP8-Ubiquitin-specific protease component of the SAGA complex n=1 Tax=Melanopsichium pennsylvanicum 4 TaxID=1398559 RepID=A0A077QQZ5_9BASI|nr:related to UBP8-Ubiquitin-specific protease component of the SAGA complex [Melanopsichium pennsylvanicum 4]